LKNGKFGLSKNIFSKEETKEEPIKQAKLFTATKKKKKRDNKDKTALVHKINLNLEREIIK
jgi:hypothetical protein